MLNNHCAASAFFLVPWQIEFSSKLVIYQVHCHTNFGLKTPIWHWTRTFINFIFSDGCCIHHSVWGDSLCVCVSVWETKGNYQFRTVSVSWINEKDFIVCECVWCTLMHWRTRTLDGAIISIWIYSLKVSCQEKVPCYYNWAMLILMCEQCNVVVRHCVTSRSRARFTVTSLHSTLAFERSSDTASWLNCLVWLLDLLWISMSVKKIRPHWNAAWPLRLMPPCKSIG